MDEWYTVKIPVDGSDYIHHQEKYNQMKEWCNKNVKSSPTGLSNWIYPLDQESNFWVLRFKHKEDAVQFALAMDN